MKIYMVSHGRYSDYRVDGLFSTKKRAEDFIKLRRPSDNVGNSWRNDYYIEEWEVDEKDQIREYHSYGAGVCGVSGEVYCILLNNEIVETTYRWGENERGFWFTAEILARDYDHAMKIAQEKYAQAKAEYEGVA